MKIACFGNVQSGLVQSIYLKIKHEAFSDTALFDVGHELDNVIDAVRKANLKVHFDIAVSLGGDGTMMAVARECSYYNLSVVGVNCGHLGFLCEYTPDSVDDLIEMISSNEKSEYKVSMLAGHIQNHSKNTVNVLNDFLIQSKDALKALNVTVELNNSPLYSFLGTGVLISTPIGSTGYNLSAGGPILVPNQQGAVITPVSPHRMTVKSVVIGSDDVVTVHANHVHGEHIPVQVVADGSPLQTLSDNQEFRVKVDKQHFAKFVRSNNFNFYSRVSELLS